MLISAREKRRSPGCNSLILLPSCDCEISCFSVAPVYNLKKTKCGPIMMISGSVVSMQVLPYTGHPALWYYYEYSGSTERLS